MSAIRVDGLYYSRDPEAGSGYYLRFYPDGTAVSTTSTGSPAQVARWFNSDNKQVGRGSYRVDGDQLRFAEQTESGVVDYDGTIGAPSGAALDLQVTSRINGHQSRHRFVFVADPSSTFGPAEPVPLEMKAPSYPKSEIPNNSAGKVVLLVDVAATGTVSAVAVESSSGVMAFDDAATQEAKQWSFVPARDPQGKPVPARMRIPLEFKPPGRNMSERVHNVLGQRCSAVNEEVARIDPDAGEKKPRNGATIDESLALVMVKHTNPGLGSLPAFADVPTVPPKATLSFYQGLSRLIDGLKARCAAQPTAIYGDVLRQELGALNLRAR